MKKYYLGIDPGKVNLGLAIISYDAETKKTAYVFSTVLVPNSYKNPVLFTKEITNLIGAHTDGHLSGVGIERFVSFDDKFTKDAEFIVQLIGSLVFYFLNYWSLGPVMVRSVEWKQALVKHLFKTKGFDNPSTSLDKKFSIAAAKACLDEGAPEFKEDHTADAICLAYTSLMKDISA